MSTQSAEATHSAETGVANRHKLMMLMATAARMGVGLIGFIIMARFLGPENFGVIATAAAYSGFVGIVTDFGLGMSALRTASAEPRRAGEIVSDAFATKLLLTVGASLIGLAIALAILPASIVGVYAMVFCGVLAYAFADLAMVAARAHRRFDTEAVIVVSTSLLILFAVAGTAALTRDLQATALAFMLTRFVYLAVTQVVLRRKLGIAIGWWRPLGRITQTIRQSSGYAMDSILTNLSSQIDVLLFGAMLVAHDVGIYQAGTRLLQAIIPVATVLSTVYLPTLAATAINKDDLSFQKTSRRLNIEFTGLAIIAGLGFAFLGPLVTPFVFGSKYDHLLPLWAGFGAFAVLRLTASSFGIQLVALGYIRTRLMAQFATIGLFVLLTFVLLPRFGLAITSWLLATSAIPTTLVLGGALIRDRHSEHSLKWSMAAAFTAFAALALYWLIEIS